MPSSTIRIIHTADNHIGKKFSSYAQNHKEKLINERFDALKRVVEAGNARRAHLLVIAGDLFDSLNIRMTDVDKTVVILEQFEGEAVLILPGNHDYYESSSEGLWARFKAKSDSDKIVLLKDETPVQFSIDEQQVVFYPGPCRSRHSETHVIGWINSIKKNSEDLHIGIAHGNVRDAGNNFLGDQYFNMTPEDLSNAGVDIWLMGHIHAPYPKVSQLSHPGYFYAATHTPDGFDCMHGGCCWYLEIDADKQLQMEQIITGAFQFLKINTEVNSEKDIEDLQNTLHKLSPERSIVEITLHGRLCQEDRERLYNTLEQYKQEWFSLEYYTDKVHLAIDKAYIDANYSQGTLSYELLRNLSSSPKYSLALQLAHQLIENK